MIRFANGIPDELLSPNLARGIELLRCTFPPRSQSCKEPYEHKGDEEAVIIWSISPPSY